MADAAEEWKAIPRWTTNRFYSTPLPAPAPARPTEVVFVLCTAQTGRTHGAKETPQARAELVARFGFVIGTTVCIRRCTIKLRRRRGLDQLELIQGRRNGRLLFLRHSNELMSFRVNQVCFSHPL